MTPSRRSSGRRRPTPAAARLADTIGELQRGLERADRAIATDLGIGSVADLRLLLTLRSEGPLRVGELATRTRSSTTTTSSRLDRLERRGLVARGRIEGDRRASVASLSRVGADKAAAVHRHRAARLEPIARAFPIDELERLAAVVAGEEEQR